MKHPLATAIALPATLLLCSYPLYGANNAPAPARSSAASAPEVSSAFEPLPRTETIGLFDKGIYWHFPNIEKSLNLSADQEESLWTIKENIWGKHEVGEKYKALKEASRLATSEQDAEVKAARIAWGNATNAAEKEFREQAPSKLNPEQEAVLNAASEWLLRVGKQSHVELKSMSEIEGETAIQRNERSRKIAGYMLISEILTPEQAARAGLGPEADRARIIDDLREGRKTEN